MATRPPRGTLRRITVHVVDADLRTIAPTPDAERAAVRAAVTAAAERVRTDAARPDDDDDREA